MGFLDLIPLVTTLAFGLINEMLTRKRKTYRIEPKSIVKKNELPYPNKPTHPLWCIVIAQSKDSTIMLLGETSLHDTYYEILSVKEDASYDQIRNSYRSAILHSHPDKLKTSRCCSSDEKFLKIQKAWQVLSDAELRVVYDNDLRSSRQDGGTTADEISIEDMSVEITGEDMEIFYQCRCGDYFSVDPSELETMGFELLRDGDCVQVRRLGASVASVVLPCGSCSLKTRVWVDSDMKIPFQDDSELRNLS